VQRNVHAVREQLEVLGRVVELVAVAMVDAFARRKPPANNVLHHQAVQQREAPAQVQAHITLAGDGAATSRAVSARARAGRRSLGQIRFE